MRDKILSARPALRAVAVPEWDATVYLRPMTLRERLQLRTDLDTADTPAKTAAVVCGAVVTLSCDEHGQPVFQPADADTLADLDGNAVERVFGEIVAANVVDPSKGKAESQPIQS